jgi:glyoxylase-like metal-dependent hydrolase (beta-lactamase superfamily II)
MHETQRIASSTDRRSFLAAVGAGLAAPTLACAPSAAAAAAAPIQAADPRPSAPPQWLRFSVGTVECTILGDGTGSMAPIQPLFAPEASKAELDAALDRAFHPRDAVKLAFNAVAVRTGGDLVLIDAGTGAPAGGPVGRLRSNLAASGLRAADVTAIVITHAHGDHLGGCIDPVDGTPAFPNAKILISKREHEFWTSSSPDLSGSRMPAEQKASMLKETQERLAKLADRIEKIDPAAKPFPALSFLDTSGHTPGHLSLMIDGGSSQCCLLADVAHNHVVMFANPEWTIGFDVDPKAAVAARRRLFDRLASDRTLVLGYHMPWPGLGHIRSLEKGFEWVIAPQ